jgi:hypothetical protein
MGNDHICTAGDRFDRIESWLEKMAAQMEKVTELLVETRLNRKTLDDHESRLRTLEKLVTKNSMMSKWAERLVWALAAAAIYMLRTNGG